MAVGDWQRLVIKLPDSEQGFNCQKPTATSKSQPLHAVLQGIPEHINLCAVFTFVAVKLVDDVIFQ